MQYRKRITALLLAGMMLLSALPLNALAVETPSGVGLCEHHPQHTAECGYTEGTAGTPCSHEHTDACYKLVENCLHEHTEDCYPKLTEDNAETEPGQMEEENTESTSEQPQKEPPAAAVMQYSLDTDAEPTECTHVCSEESGCITKHLDCQHQHDEGCGYSPAVEGTDCTFVCEICQQQEGNTVDWPETPNLPDGPPQLGDGQTAGEIYGQPVQQFSAQSLKLMQSQSQSAAAALDEKLRITEDELDKITFIYVNGTPYDGSDLTVTEGDNFSYMHSWAPKADTTFTDGSWFEYELFQVPGLNLKKEVKSTLVINGIKVGEYMMTYDQNSGEMTYRVVFNRFIQFFDPTTVLALFQGSGKFSKANISGPIANGDKTGTLTINPRPPLPEVPTGPSGGTGWSPSKAPTFNNNIHAFGKGVKWSSKDDSHAVPQIEWRVVFLEQLQKTQRAFLNQGSSALEPSKDYLIIEDTLDVNQQFYFPSESKYEQEAPFFLELPVIVPGTGNILNGLSDIGNGSYDGPGEVSPVITGANFTKIDGSRAATLGEVRAVQKQVRDTPLTWTVTTHPETKEQTLLINTGVLGTTDPLEGITWSMANANLWPDQKLNELIANCDTKIDAIRTGADSPITLLATRQNALLNQLRRVAARPDAPENAQQQLEEWRTDFQSWHKNEKVGPLIPLVDQDANLIVELPKLDLAKEFADWQVDAKTTVSQTSAYKDYIKSLENLKNDQATYLENRLQYGKDWEAAKKHYENTKEFYQNGQIYGFVVKVRSTSINTSAGSYKNTVEIRVDDSTWKTDDTADVQFSSGIMGNFSLGDVVVQKADAYYNTSADDDKDIQAITKANAGLAGAQFQVYFDDTGTSSPDQNVENLGHFLEKAASEKEDTYIFTHFGTEDIHTGLQGEVTYLETAENGKLILGRIPPNSSPWLVETKAPAGYYLDPTPIPINSKDGAVTYYLRPNHSRSVLLYKTDSFSGNPVEGAEFTLYQADGITPVTGFSEKTLNGHTTYWYDKTGSATLKTNTDGQLCIHGLDAGSYVLIETQPAPGYLKPQTELKYEFTLSEKLPKNDTTQSYDEDFHLLLNTEDTPLENNPDVASLTVKKQTVGKQPLANAGFVLFRFTGTEADWKASPDDENKWVVVTPNEQGSSYFKTTNKTNGVTLTGEGKWNNQTVTAAFTGENGDLTITGIPVGHYSIAEVQAPSDEYNRDYRSFYFTVDGKTAGTATSPQLYTDTGHKTELTGNTLTNYKRKIQLALVKYDAAGNQPSIEGEAVNNGHLYTDSILQTDSNHTGLPGAVYKLFMRRGGSSDQANPHESELNTETIQGYVQGYDTCLAVGTTGANGVLKLSDMKGRNNTTLEGGLNPENYYMIEVKAPNGYLLDQTPIYFVLDEKVFPADEDATAGLVMTASNRKTDYGLRLQKVDSSTVGDGKTPTGLSGAEFTVKQNETTLYFSGADGTYQLAAEGTQNAVEKVVTGKNGMLTITGLEAGKSYIFTETKAPQGFSNKKEDGTPFTVTLTTPTSAQDGTLADGVLYAQTEQVENQRLLGKMILHKEDAETNQALAGAEFTLYRTEVTVIPPNDPAYDPENPNATRSEDFEVAKGTTNDQGNLTFDNLEWEQFYYVLETKAPEGYVLDQTKRQFSINENSFDADGNPIPILFPLVTNSKGTLGKAVLYKADEEDHSIKLSDAHFYLMKKVGQDANGKEIWTGYGQGMYITDENGEIHFLLPPGQYKLIEMKAPDGYILEAMKELPFTISETPGEEALVIDEPDSDDGVVTNRKGDSGIRILKTLGASNSPVPGVTFQIGWEVTDMAPPFETTYQQLSFIHRGGGNYAYTEDSTAPGVTTELVTNEDGMIYVMMPADLDYTSDDSVLASLYYQEIKAPAGLEVKSQPKTFTLTDGIYTEAAVSNSLKSEGTKSLSITINKMDGKSKKGLSGAEFALYWYDGRGEDMAGSHIPMGTGTTDENGKLVFDAGNVDDLFGGLMAGETYHIVETKAPDGYVLDETHHEVTLDASHFDEDFTFVGVPLEIHNYQIRGSVQLVKADDADEAKKLAGAEFELLRKVEHGDPMETQWEHYGQWRYTTNANGELRIENLPYGSYQLVERAAPLGYLLDDPAWTRTFQIDIDGQHIDLGVVTNKADPNPTRDVYVQKVAAHDSSLGLSGAEFELYELQQDGNYHLRQHNVYITDASGGFVIGELPVGSYALKETKAPAGYELPEQTTTYFSVQVQDREVRLQIQNTKSESGGGEEPSAASITVQKVWRDNPSAQRPDNILVQLYRNGTAYGRPVALNADSGWQYRWNDLEEGVRWTVDEVQVPDGYQKSVTHEGNAWTITNTAEGNVPTDPNQPIDPNKPTDPNQPGGSNQPAGHVTQTNDPTRLSLWITMMALSVIGLLLVWLASASRKKKEGEQ